MRGGKHGRTTFRPDAKDDVAHARAIDQWPARLWPARKRVAHLRLEPKRRDFPQEIFPLEDAPKKYTKQVHLRLHTAHLKPESMDAVRDLIAAHPGKCPLMFCFRYPTGKTVFVEPNDRYFVAPSHQLQQRADELFGEETYYVKVDMTLPEKQQRWGKKAESGNGEE